MREFRLNEVPTSVSHPIIHFLKSIKQVSPKLKAEIDEACALLTKEPKLIPSQAKKILLLVQFLVVQKDPAIMNNEKSRDIIRKLEKSLENHTELKFRK